MINFGIAVIYAFASLIVGYIGGNIVGYQMRKIDERKHKK